MPKNLEKKRNVSPAGIIAVAVAVTLAVLLIGVLLFGPALAARPVFANALKASKTSDGTVLLCDPYVESDPLPDAKEVTLTGSEGDEIVQQFLSAFKSYRYVETRSIGGAKLWPYLCVKGGPVAYFYLEEDSVWVEKNSTFYRFRPGNSEGEAAYAELYKTVMEYLSEDADT